MYAVVELGGHQHKVEKDQIILTELTGTKAGEEFSCDKVVAVGAGGDLKIGKPYVSGATVKFKVVDLVRGPKLRGFKYRKRKGYRLSWGHRQDLQKIQVIAIQG